MPYRVAIVLVLLGLALGLALALALAAGAAAVAGAPVLCRSDAAVQPASSHSADLPALRGFLTAPLSRLCRSARPVLPS